MEEFYIKENAIIVETDTEMQFFSKKRSETGAYLLLAPYKILDKKDIAQVLLDKIRGEEAI